MNSQPAARGCCSNKSGTALDATELAELGARRRSTLRHIAAWASVALCAAALAVYFELLPLGGPDGITSLDGRLAIAAALMGTPRLLGSLRELMVSRRATPQVALGLALAVLAVAGYPLVVAVVVAAVLVADLVRPAAVPVRQPAEQG